jgi:hypothetical protein
MNRNTWKSGERRIAKIFGTYRTPLSGSNSRHSKSDSLHSDIFIETKHRKKIPGDTLWEHVKKDAKKENKIPIIVFIKKGSPKPVALCNLRDLKKIAKYIVKDEIEDEEDVEEV